MDINKILYRTVRFADNYSFPFRNKLFEILTKQNYDVIFDEDPDVFWDEHSAILNPVIDKLDKNSIILDLWCWAGKDPLLLAKKWWYVDAVELSQKGLNILQSKIDESIKNKIVLHPCSIRNYLKRNTKQYDLILCKNSLQYDLDWKSRIREMKNSTLSWWYNALAWPLHNYMPHWRWLDKQKILDLYRDWEIILMKERNNRTWNYDGPRLYFIAQKK